MAEEEKDYLTLSFDDGEDIEYEVVGTVENDGQEYIVLIPTENDDVIEIYRLTESEDDPDSEEITVIEDDDEYMAVINTLRGMGFQIEVDEAENVQ